MFNTSVACDLAHLDYQIVAQGYGGDGVLLKTTADIIPACQRAQVSNFPVLRFLYCKLIEPLRFQDQARAGHAFLLNALIAKSNFRKGSISV